MHVEMGCHNKECPEHLLRTTDELIRMVGDGRLSWYRDRLNQQVRLCRCCGEAVRLVTDTLYGINYDLILGSKQGG
ncbi:hypothetical protein [Geobacter sp.]|uniref:hypothetical protein n=1 Tax=Geobacter sp. TaxID=46610 RepID=UPI00260382DA|nr:hypothetical protein [Geobacter sp.]